MKKFLLLAVFGSGAIIGWGAHTIHPNLDAKCPKEIVVQHPDPDSAGCLLTRVRLCRVGDTDLEAIPNYATPSEYWVVTINGVKHCGIGSEIPQKVHAK